MFSFLFTDFRKLLCGFQNHFQNVLEIRLGRGGDRQLEFLCLVLRVVPGSGFLPFEIEIVPIRFDRLEISGNHDGFQNGGQRFRINPDPVVRDKTVPLNVFTVQIFGELFRCGASAKQQGHRKIAFLNGPLYFTNAEDRKRGFLNALAEFNIPLSDFFIEHGAFREDDGYLTTRKFLSERPDALICSDDQQLLGAFRAIQEAGLHVPEEIALACSNHSMFIKIAVPKITLIDIFPEKLGTAAAEKLIAIISGKKTENATILDAELIPGN